jgi:3-oxoacyl-[acyl-carrier-protein] synthase III
MGAIIQSIGISTDQSVRSSIAHATIAGKNCLEASGVAALDVGLLINCGIFRDKNMVEPGMAALIQKGLGINLDYINLPVRKSAFSFDLMYGAIGVLHAMYVANSFLQSDQLEHVIIVSSEAHPSNLAGANFPYATMGSAMLLSKGDDPAKGFQSFGFSSSEKLNIGASGSVQPLECGITGREAMTFSMAADYPAQALDFARQFAHGFMEKNHIDKANTSLISSQIDADFALQLACALDLAPEAMPSLFANYGDTYTSSFALGLYQLRTQNALPEGRQVLFAGVSSGLTAGCVAYNN